MDNTKIITERNKFICLRNFIISIIMYSFLTSNIPSAEATTSGANYHKDIPEAASNVGYETIEKNIFILGGFSQGLEISNKVYVYDTVNRIWKQKANMLTPRYDHTVTAVGNNLYAIGGHNGSEKFNVNEMYDTKIDQWFIKSPMPVPLEDMESESIGDKIYVFGGNSKNGISNKVYIYDTKQDKWTTGRDMPYSTNAMGIAVIGNDIHIIGGDKHLNSHIVYNVVTDTWRVQKDMPTGRSHLVAFTYNDKIYALGGTVARGLFDIPLNTLEVYNPTSDTWEELEGMYTPRSRFGLGVVGNEVYAISGWTPNWLSKTFDIVKMEE